jgi:hypothetical protein
VVMCRQVRALEWFGASPQMGVAVSGHVRALEFCRATIWSDAMVSGMLGHEDGVEHPPKWCLEN